jgi:predicted phosphodiesterase
MRVAAIYDIHGNLPALEAVLQDVQGVDLVIVGGDVVPGPMAREALERLLHWNVSVQFIQGNGEVAVLAEMAGKDSNIPQHFREVVRWNAQQFDAEDKQLLGAWPKTLQIEVDGLGKVLFCHATPRNETEIFTRLTPEQSLLPVFAGIEASVAVCGHTHMQFDRMIGRVRVVNAGSVGMPYGEPGAYWLLLGPEIQFRHTRYNLSRAAERIRSTSYPQAQEFGQGLLRPRAENEMLELFAKAELK